MEGCKYNIYVKGDEPEKLEPMDILISDRRELEVLRLCLGERVNFVMGNPKKNTTFRISAEADLSKLDWDYRNPEEAYSVIERIKMPLRLSRDYRKEHRRCKKNMCIRCIREMC